MSWIIFSLVTPLFFSFTNLIEKFLIEKRIKELLTIVILGGFIYAAVGVGTFAVHGPAVLTPVQTGALLMSGMFLVLYLIPYFKALPWTTPRAS